MSSQQPASLVAHNCGDASQPIVISDTPSPAVSIITIHSDTEDEDDRKFPPERCDHIYIPTLYCSFIYIMLLFSVSYVYIFFFVD